MDTNDKQDNCQLLQLLKAMYASFGFAKRVQFCPSALEKLLLCQLRIIPKTELQQALIKKEEKKWILFISSVTSKRCSYA